MELLFAVASQGAQQTESISLQSFNHRRSGLHMPVSSIDLLPCHRNPTLPRYASTTATLAAPSICHTFTHTVFTILWYRKVLKNICRYIVFFMHFIFIHFCNNLFVFCNWYLSFAIYYQFNSVWHASWHYIFLFPKMKDEDISSCKIQIPVSIFKKCQKNGQNILSVCRASLLARAWKGEGHCLIQCDAAVQIIRTNLYFKWFQTQFGSK